MIRGPLAQPTIIDPRFINERGQGEGAVYTPWLHIQDVASRGRVHRIKGWKHSRVHHLLSDLEAKVFFIYEWALYISDIREQYPLLPLDETLSIAKECGIVHPVDVRSRYPIVMTTDFVLTIKRNLATIYHARSVKYAADLLKARTLEKLEIERRYWQARKVDWGIVTEQVAPSSLVRNIRWVHPFYHLADLYPLRADLVHEIAYELTRQVVPGTFSLRHITEACDSRLKLTSGRSLAVVRHLLANRHWEVDMSKMIRSGEPLILLKPPRVFTETKSGLRA